jgi:hypothetical protein
MLLGAARATGEEGDEVSVSERVRGVTAARLPTREQQLSHATSYNDAERACGKIRRLLAAAMVTIRQLRCC